MPERAFQQIDVFSQRPGDGNPLAVVLDAQGLSDADMQRFATWANLSETTYLLPPTEAGLAAGADYRVRIFSPGGELSFAGHPTLGSCHAWLKAGGSPRVPGSIVQECAGGLVRIEQSDGLLAFAAPPMQRSAPNPALLALVTGALGLRPQQVLAAQVLDNGPRWLALLLDGDRLFERGFEFIKQAHGVLLKSRVKGSSAIDLIGGGTQNHVDVGCAIGFFLVALRLPKNLPECFHDDVRGGVFVIVLLAEFFVGGANAGRLVDGHLFADG